jgi:hypothetical protein
MTPYSSILEASYGNKSGMIGAAVLAQMNIKGLGVL